MSKKNKKNLKRIIIAAAFFAVAAITRMQGATAFAMYFAAFVIVGYDVVIGAVRNIANGQIFDENFLMMIATIGAFIVGEYPEGAAVMMFFQVGELFQDYAVNKSRKSISSLMDIRPDFANVVSGDTTVKTDPYDVKLNDIIVVNPGERVPLDGIVISGTSTLDTSALTGESLPREVQENSEILSGCININGVIKVKVTKEYEQSTVNRILDLVENASNKKSKSEKFITKFAKYYTPTVVVFALILAIIPPLFIKGAMWQDWVYRALTFLVISCPCALVISVPLSFFGGLGGASSKGVLIKGSNYLETLAKTNIVVFDKTGTLTKGKFDVVKVNGSENTLEIASAAEMHSSHPIAACIKNAVTTDIIFKAENVQEKAGYGVTCDINSVKTFVGNSKLMAENNIKIEEVVGNTVVYVAQNGVCIGSIIIEDTLKPDAELAVKALKNVGVTKTVMLTGDSKAVGEKIANQLGLDKVYTELLPDQKVDQLEKLLAEKSTEKEKLCYVGDGINDAPVLARADVGVAMGALGSDAAIEAADVVIMNDEPSKIVTAINISRKTLGIVKQNIAFALGVKLLVLLLGAMGIATMWEAVFSDVGVAVIAILNSMRALNTKNM